MNPAQNGMYHAEKAKWQKACRALGRPCDDAALRALHAKVGAPHSSTKFSQDNLTDVIGEFKSISDMGNLDAQLNAQVTLKDRLLAEITALQAKSDIKGGMSGLSRYFHKWLDGRAVEKLDTETLCKLRGMLERRVKQLVTAPSPTASPEVPADPDFDPSAPFG